VDTGLVILIVLGVWAFYNIVNYVGMRKLMRWLYGRYKNEAAALENDSSIHETFKVKSGLREERAVLEILSRRRSHLFDLSLVVSNIEFILITGSTVLILNSQNGLVNISSLTGIALVVLSWMGIKVLGYGGHWQQPIFGRSVFSVFLIGTLINVTLGFFAGWLLSGIS